MHALMVGTRLSDLIVFRGKDGDLAANPGPTMAHVDIDFILFHPLHLSLWGHSSMTFAMAELAGCIG